MHSEAYRNTSLFLASFIFSVAALAQSVDLTDFVEKKKFIIAGTLNPPSLSLNGQQLETPTGQFKNLFVNGEQVSITITESLKTFYHSLDSDNLSLEWEKTNGERINFLKLEFPSLNQVKTNGYDLQWNFSPSVTQAKLDTQDISLENSVTQIDNLKKWIKQPHVLEVTSQKTNSQIYQLNFSGYQRDIFRRYNFYFSFGEPSLNYFWGANSAGFGLGQYFEDDRYFDIVYYYSERDQIFDMGNSSRPVNQKLYELKTHYGYQVFNTNWNDFDLLRLTLGAQGEVARYLRTSTTPDSFDGFFTDKVDHSYAVIGTYFRWEPWQYKNFSFAITLDFPLLATNDVSKIKTNAYFLINYNFK